MSQQLSRRSVLVAGLVAAPAIALVGGCTGDDQADPDPSPTPTPTQDPDVPALESALSRERDLLAVYASAPADSAAALAPFVLRHQAHAAELERAVAALAPSSTTSPAAPGGAPGAMELETLAAAETAAADAGLGQLGLVSAQLGRVLASIAACESAHAALLRSA